MTIGAPLIVIAFAVAGLLLFAFSEKPKPQDIGKITYACALLALMFFALGLWGHR